MENTLWNGMIDLNNITTTENSDKAYKSTLNPLLDFLFKGGTMRDENPNNIAKLFARAFMENPVYAIRLAFYTRDIRGGQGERRVFRICMEVLSAINPNMFNKIVSYIPEYGRWDDLVYLFINIRNANCKNIIINLIKDQITEDLHNYEDNKSCSLLAKWLPSENASAENTITAAKSIRKELNLNSKDYRKMLSSLRKHLNVLETKLTAKEWNTIDYNTVPSKAMMKYRNAFTRNDNARYTEYVNKLANPEVNGVKVNAENLYQFDIISKIMYTYLDESDPNNKLYDAQWKALPDFFADKFDNALVVADVSGSMSGDPINVCLGLAIYIAEHNKGLFNNKFITFSNKPQLQEIVGKTISEKAFNLNNADWEQNTDIDAVFHLIYKTAIANKLQQNDLPSMLYIISDMQFDCCNGGENISVFEKWQSKFTEVGYKLPTVCFWNVSNYGNENVPITVKSTGAIVCSGYSPAIIKFIMDADCKDSLSLVKSIVESDRYKKILEN